MTQPTHQRSATRRPLSPEKLKAKFEKHLFGPGSCSPEQLQQYIDAGVNVNAQNALGDTVVHTAIGSGDNNALKLLLKAKPDMGIQNKQGNTYVHLAVKRTHTQAVALLLRARADIHTPDKVGNTTLHSAVFTCVFSTIKALVKRAKEGKPDDANAFLNAQDEGKNTALHNALRHKQFKVARLLIDAGADLNIQNNDKDTAVHMAILSQDPSTIRALVKKIKERGPNYAKACLDITDKNGDTALHKALRYRKVEAAGLFIDAGASLNLQSGLDNKTALHIAVANGYTKIIEKLLGAGADVGIPDEHENTALHLAAEHGNIKALRLLVKAVQAKNPKDLTCLNARGDGGNTALHWASLNNNTDSLTLLLGAGADIFANNEYEQTALHIAAAKGYTSIVEKLVKKALATGQKNARRYLNIPDQGGNTALHMAVGRNNPALVELLLGAGADIFAKNKTGDSYMNIEYEQTALHIAAAKGYTSIVEKLVKKALAKGQDNARRYLNTPDQGGNTALHMAVGRNNPALVKLLLDAGADIFAKNKNKKTPLHLAVLKKDTTILSMLVEAAKERGPEYTQKYLKYLNADNEGTESLLLSAARFVNNKALALLLEAKPDVNEMPFLQTVAGWRNDEAVELFLKAGADVNARDNYGNTALLIAARTGNIKTIELLIRARADINARDNNGNTVVHRAAQSASAQAVALLFKAGAKTQMYVRNKDGLTPMHLSVNPNATIYDSTPPGAVREMLKAGASAYDIIPLDMRPFQVEELASDGTLGGRVINVILTNEQLKALEALPKDKRPSMGTTEELLVLADNMLDKPLKEITKRDVFHILPDLVQALNFTSVVLLDKAKAQGYHRPDDIKWLQERAMQIGKKFPTLAQRPSMDNTACPDFNHWETYYGVSPQPDKPHSDTEERILARFKEEDRAAQIARTMVERGVRAIKKKQEQNILGPHTTARSAELQRQGHVGTSRF